MTVGTELKCKKCGEAKGILLSQVSSGSETQPILNLEIQMSSLLICERKANGERSWKIIIF